MGKHHRNDWHDKYGHIESGGLGQHGNHHIKYLELGRKYQLDGSCWLGSSTEWGFAEFWRFEERCLIFFFSFFFF
jgi:hypothetical protein